MNGANEFHNLNDAGDVSRELAPGINARIFIGDNAMLSIVDLRANAKGTIHSHPEEQWGVLLEGEGVRVQGGSQITVKQGDFWRTPGGVSHGFIAGPNGARILDIFSPPRKEYKKPGAGFGSGA